jgi:hypothetical protein
VKEKAKKKEADKELHEKKEDKKRLSVVEGVDAPGSD